MAPPPRISRARLLAVTKVGLDVALTTAKREQRSARTFMIVGWIGGRLRSKEKAVSTTYGRLECWYYCEKGNVHVLANGIEA